MYELHYSTGGHGGPYDTLENAVERAKRLLFGNRSEHHVYVRRGVSGPLVATVSRADASDPMLASVRYHSFAAEVVADSSGEFCGNSVRFATREEAEGYVADLAWRWTLVSDTRVVESSDPVTDSWTDGRLVSVR